MIEGILPAGVASAEQLGEHTGALLPEEEPAVLRAVPKRRVEYAAGRTCARKALASLGIPTLPIPTGSNREPIWPPGIVGSITHCAGYCAAVAAPKGILLTIGVDAELHQPLPDGIFALIAREDEIPPHLTHETTGIHWDRLIFSAKESIFKAWYPLTGTWLGFEDAIVTFEPGTNTFRACLLVEPPPSFPRELTGRYLVHGDHVLTSVAVPA